MEAIRRIRRQPLALGIGDVTPGYGDLGWAARVADVLQQIHADLAYCIAASVGATTAQALEEQADRIEAFGPDLLHLNSGANDIMRRRPDWARSRTIFARCTSGRVAQALS